jgi:DNA-binding response OmpR family regulator
MSPHRQRLLADGALKEEVGMESTVLIVDDDVNAQIIIETLLRLREFEVRVTADVEEAADIIARADVGVVVVDLNMPGMNGFEGVRRLRAASGAPATAPRVIVTTDRSAPEVDRFAQRIGADAVLRRPLEPGRLIATVERLMPAVGPRVTHAGRA